MLMTSQATMSVTTGDCCEKCKEKAAGCLDVLLTLIRIKNHKETARHMNDKKIDPVKKSPNKSPTRHSISRQHPEGEELERVLDTESMSTLKTFDERHWSDMDKFELEPLLYTQKDLDEVLKARQNDFEEMLRARELEWKKEKKLFETKLQEEIAMRDLVEQDSKEKIDNLRKEILEMKKVVEEYEKHIIQLSENTQTDTLVKQEKFAEILREKEQLQQELNNTESSLYKAYKRMEELKEAVEQFQKNEQEYKAYQEQLKGQVNSTQQKYDKLRKHAEEKIEHANREIAKVRKEKESDLAGVQAALKKATSKIGSLEQQLQQKISENIELEKICDDLISRVSADS